MAPFLWGTYLYVNLSGYLKSFHGTGEKSNKVTCEYSFLWEHLLLSTTLQVTSYKKRLDLLFISVSWVMTMEEMVLLEVTCCVRTGQQSQLTPEQVEQILSIRAETVGFTTKSTFLTEGGYLWKNTFSSPLERDWGPGGG